jgi:hypothetical protein
VRVQRPCAGPKDRLHSRALHLGSVSAQSPTYHLGRTPTPEEIKAWDIAISPDGHELPPGHGTAKEGRDLFIEKGCSQCHGRNGEGGKAPTLIVMKGCPPPPAGQCREWIWAFRHQA